MKFIDLFCGIGGFRLSLESAGGQCVFSADIDKHACSMYETNFGDNPYCDISLLNPKQLPDFDVLCAGFPCQPFSNAGKQQGFQDTRGTLFFDICNIVEHKQPSVLFLENVKNLLQHDKGNTFKIIQNKLIELGYNISWKVLSAKEFGIPQHRERIVIIGIHNKRHKQFDFSTLNIDVPSQNLEQFLTTFVKDQKQLSLHTENYQYLSLAEYCLIDPKFIKQQPKSGLIFCGYRNKKLRVSGVLPNTEHLSRVHKQFNRIYDAKGMHPTISSQEASGRYFIYIDKRVRKLTLDECFALMGFPIDFKKIGSKSKLYARIGNSVCVTMMSAIAKEIKKQVFNH